MIKKLLRASAASLFAIALVLSFCSCAGTSESDTQSLVSNPFETSENLNSEIQIAGRKQSALMPFTEWVILTVRN